MLKLAAARHHLEADSAADALVAEARTDLRVTLADVRRLVYELRPPALDQLGLVHAIHERYASRKDPTDGSWLPHVRIRPNGAGGKRALRVFELDFQSVRIDVLGAR